MNTLSDTSAFQAQFTTIHDNIYLFAFAATALLVVLEYAQVFKQGKLNWKYVLDTFTSFFTLIMIPVFVFSTGLYLLDFLGDYVHENYAIAHLGDSWLAVFLVILAADFTYYWEHRMFHRVGFLWATHTVHHSSENFNTPMAYRFGPLDTTATTICHLPLTLVFDPLLVVYSAAFIQIYQFWIHSAIIGKLPKWFEYVFNTPYNHRVHHATNKQYIDKNYGGIFIIFDRWFGTYEPYGEKATYGITKQLKHQDPVSVFFHGLYRFGKKLLTSRSPKEVLYCFIMPPGWQTRGEQERHEALEGLPVEKA